SQKGKHWVDKRLEEVAIIGSGYAFKSSAFGKEGKYQVIRMGNVRQGIIRHDENPVFVSSIDKKIMEKALLYIDNIIITQTGSKGKRDYGYTAMIGQENLLLNQRLSFIRSKGVLNKFLLYYTWSELFRDQFFKNENGTVGQ